MNTPDSAEDQSFRDFESAIMEIQGRLQFKLITRIYFGCDSEQSEDPTPAHSDDWSLVDKNGHHHRLPKTMLFMGREECDIVVKTQSVDKRHAVITFDHYLDKFKIKDLSTNHGTYVNDKKIQDQEYVTLNHMDTVQLGNDSTMYHIERVPDSGVSSGDLQVERAPPSMPHWASRELPHMMECQGCIAEQRIAHTCGNHTLDNVISQREQMAADMQHAHHVQHRPHVHSMHQDCPKHVNKHSSEYPPSFPQGSEYPSEYPPPVPRGGEYSPQSEYPRGAHYPGTSEYPPPGGEYHRGGVYSEYPAGSEYVRHSEYPDSGQDTQSRRGMMNAQQEEQSKITQSGLGSNTWPRKRIRNTVNISRFFHEDISGSRMSIDDTNYACSSRVLRGEGGHPDNLPPELETVKKGTPLYGQPDWWGEEEVKGNVRGEGAKPPSDLPLNQTTSPDTKTTPTADLNSMSSNSSVSKDSLLNTSSPDKSTSEGVQPPPTKMPEGGASTAFTVDFGEDESPKRTMSGKSLSEFMPSKIRKSFRDRKDKALGAKASKESSSKASSPGSEKDVDLMSPGQQKKIEDIWTSPQRKTRELKRSAKSTEQEQPKQESTPKKPAQKTGLHRRSLSTGRPVPAKLSRPKENGEAPATKSPKQPKGKELDTTDSASFLIDKMFAGDSKTPAKGRRTPKSLKTDRSSDRFSEHSMYSESKSFDSSVAKSQSAKVGRKPVIMRKDSNKAIPVSKKSPEKKPEVLPVAPPDNTDNVSETGTYTIEGDKPSEEEDKARQKIDTVFGINDTKPNVSKSAEFSELSTDRKPSSEDLILENLEDEEDLRGLEKKRSRGPEASSVEVEVGSSVVTDLLITEDQENPSDAVPSSAPTWVTQWAALTSKSKTSEPTSPSSSVSDKDTMMSPDSKKPSKGLSRKRPGTGRRLPTIPGKSPDGSNCSSRLSQSTDSQSPRCPSTPRYGENNNIADKQKAVTISSHVVKRSEGTDTESISRTKFDSESEVTSVTQTDEFSTPKTTSRSTASVDTEVLLKDTQTVMAAMEARMDSKSGGLHNGHVQDDGDNLSDTESTAALVNGHEGFLKSNLYTSPRESLAKTRGFQQHKPVSRNSSASERLQAFRDRNYKNVTPPENSVVSDVLSENCDLNQSIDRTSECSDTGVSFNRSGSKGKGTISMTRPNRAFQLRRARADGEVPDTPSSGVSEAVSLTNVSSASSSRSVKSSTPTRSMKAANRLSYPYTKQDSARSKESLGAAIVQRSREGGPQSSSRSNASLGAKIAQKASSNQSSGSLSNVFNRSDGGRYSLKLNRSLSSQDSINIESSNTPSRKPDFKSVKSKLKTTPTYGLSVTGINSNRSSVTSASSRSNSPRSAEKAAWKRRKEYDPRKAVAEAKAKAKDVKVKMDNQGKPKMIRSASFTNTAELQKYRRQALQKKDSVSSPDELSCASEGTGSMTDNVYQRSFIPYSGRSQSSRILSTEEEESSMIVKSTQDLSSGRYKSAFTPPPQNSVPSPPLMPLSVFKKRNSFESYETRHGVTRHKAQLEPPVQQSYDNILVSSIYQLSLKLKTNTEKTLMQLKLDQRIEDTSSPSPIDDILNQSSSNSDIPGWKAANQELAAILTNLRKTEHRIHMMHKALYPDDDSCSDSPGLSGREKREYLQEIERIRSELAGFQPIAKPQVIKDDQASIESDCEELGTADEFF
ncbi:centrosomal protein of 170 kDa protein B-like isoform X2 [Saccostrea cucullata]|uniref:centrosomal protein of 170 kDa protein B-like isoform X2 n=1 Tax=Saccostrea cuccullata TaxID=36930 RepID=UPI002ED682B7